MTPQFLIEQLFKYYPQIAGYTTLILIGVYFTVKITKFCTRTNQTNKSLPKIENALVKITNGLSTLNTILLEKSVINQSCFSNQNSPRVVNPIGEKLLMQSGADKLLEDLKQELIEALNQRNFDSLLKLERESLNILLERMGDPRFKGIQNFAFENPTFQNNPLTFTDVLFVMSLKLRDAYQSAHPERNLA